jgi:hypothetical protein
MGQKWRMRREHPCAYLFIFHVVFGKCEGRREDPNKPSSRATPVRLTFGLQDRTEMADAPGTTKIPFCSSIGVITININKNITFTTWQHLCNKLV